jgi:hypothetical protein
MEFDLEEGFLNGVCISISNLVENIAWQTHKDDLRPEARGPLKSGARGSCPTCHPQTPAVVMTIHYKQNFVFRCISINPKIPVDVSPSSWCFHLSLLHKSAGGSYLQSNSHSMHLNMVSVSSVFGACYGNNLATHILMYIVHLLTFQQCERADLSAVHVLVG